MIEAPKKIAFRDRPLRFKLGIVAVALCGLLYLSILVTLFLPLEPAQKAGVIGTTVAVAEGFMLLGIAGVGKEMVDQIKKRFGLKKPKQGQILKD